MLDLGQLAQIVVCVSAVCVCWPKRNGPTRTGLTRINPLAQVELAQVERCLTLLCVGPRWTPPPLRRTAQNFALSFLLVSFFLSPGVFLCLFSSLRGSSRGIVVVFWSVGTSSVLVCLQVVVWKTPAIGLSRIGLNRALPSAFHS